MKLVHKTINNNDVNLSSGATDWAKLAKLLSGNWATVANLRKMQGLFPMMEDENFMATMDLYNQIFGTKLELREAHFETREFRSLSEAQRVDVVKIFFELHSEPSERMNKSMCLLF